MSANGMDRPSRLGKTTSVLPPKADIPILEVGVRFVPIGDIGLAYLRPILLLRRPPCLPKRLYEGREERLHIDHSVIGPDVTLDQPVLDLLRPSVAVVCHWEVPLRLPCAGSP